MHITDALLSPVVGGVMTAAGAGAVMYAARKTAAVTADEDDKSVPLMGVTGAFVFAAQMINIAIPGTGASGHIGGGIILAALLGPYRALLSLTSVLIIQCLFFGDGGLLALGCNIINMGVCMGWLAYGLVFKPIINKGLHTRNITLASIAASVVGLQLGAFCVVVETTLSGVAGLSFGMLAALMQPIHLAIGLLEGIVTAAVLCFVYHVRPALLHHSLDTRSGMPVSRLCLIFMVCALLAGGLLSVKASNQPDGLEWSLFHARDPAALEDEPESLFHTYSNQITQKTTVMPEYTLDGEKASSLAGILGSLIAVVMAGGIGLLLRTHPRTRHRNNEKP